jgi:hypothetical protein
MEEMVMAIGRLVAFIGIFLFAYQLLKRRQGSSDRRYGGTDAQHGGDGG